MTPLELLVTLRDRGVRLTPNVTTVRVETPRGALTPALRGAIREHKAALLDLVEEIEERSAILEYEAGMSRAEADRLAGGCVLGMHTDVRQEDTPPWCSQEPGLWTASTPKETSS